MKNRILKLCLAGIPIGVTAGVLISILISLKIGDGSFHAVVPELAADLGSEIAAVIVQTAVTCVYGAAIAASSAIWQTEWSMLKKTVVYFVINSVTILPIAYYMRWMKRSLGGFLLYFGCFAAVYAVIYAMQYIAVRNKLKKLNEVQNRLNAITEGSK